jgi:hypothetical protein
MDCIAIFPNSSELALSASASATSISPRLSFISIFIYRTSNRGILRPIQHPFKWDTDIFYITIVAFERNTSAHQHYSVSQIEYGPE